MVQRTSAYLLPRFTNYEHFATQALTFSLYLYVIIILELLEHQLYPLVYFPLTLQCVLPKNKDIVLHHHTRARWVCVRGWGTGYKHGP